MHQISLVSNSVFTNHANQALHIRYRTVRTQKSWDSFATLRYGGYVGL